MELHFLEWALGLSFLLPYPGLLSCSLKWQFRLPLFSLLYFRRLCSHLKQKLFILPSYLLFLPWIPSYLCQDACFSEWQEQQKEEVMEILIDSRIQWTGKGVGSLASSTSLPLTSCVIPGPHSQWSFASWKLCIYDLVCFFFPSFFSIGVCETPSGLRAGQADLRGLPGPRYFFSSLMPKVAVEVGLLL